MSALNLHHVVSGPTDKPALIFLHGFPFDHTMWDAQVALCAPHFCVVTYDLRGHGQSDVGSGQYIFEFFVDDLFGLMDSLKIQKAILCGLSIGGYIALRAIEREPERVQGLVLCDTRSQADTDAGKIGRAADAASHSKTEGLNAFADKFLKKRWHL